MLRRSPLKAKRATPRRNEGRVTHVRVKPRATGTTAEEALHLKTVRGLGCLICGAPANAHHVMHAPGKEKRRDHRFVVPLCPVHHQGDRKDGSVHGLGSEEAFKAHWGVDLVQWSIAAWFYRELPQHPFWRDSVTRCRGIAFAKLMEDKGGRGVTRKDEQQGRFTRPDPNA